MVSYITIGTIAVYANDPRTLFDDLVYLYLIDSCYILGQRAFSGIYTSQGDN